MTNLEPGSTSVLAKKDVISPRDVIDCMINIYRLGGVTLSSRQLYAHVLNLLVKALTETNKDFYNKKGKCLNLDDIGGCKVSFASCDQKPHHITTGSG